ncbi:MAG: hypothetical protein M3Z16_00800, partial [Pseudomonadota bacterium]|nr:hypothetical protein [Pseudomonadota bacterium]
MGAILQVLRDPQLDRSPLREALALAIERNDPVDVLLHAAGHLLVSGVADDHYDGFEDAIGAVTANLSARASIRDAAEQLLVDAGELVARWFVSLEDPTLATLAERIVPALGTNAIATDLRAAAAVAVLSYV